MKRYLSNVSEFDQLDPIQTVLVKYTPPQPAPPVRTEPPPVLDVLWVDSDCEVPSDSCGRDENAHVSYEQVAAALERVFMRSGKEAVFQILQTCGSANNTKLRHLRDVQLRFYPRVLQAAVLHMFLAMAPRCGL